jgi:hypothetical protein
VDSIGILRARLNIIINGLSAPALTELLVSAKQIESFYLEPRTEPEPPLVKVIRGKLKYTAIRPPIVLDTEEGDRNPCELELANKIRDYFSNGTR